MKINGKPYRTIWVNEDGWSISVIDQTKLPFKFEIATLRKMD
jgi:methylthioribose-1-phosphate isomerase